MSKEVKDLLKELIIGVLGYEIVLSILTTGFCIWQGYDLVPALLGILLGFVGVVLMLLDMGAVTDMSVKSGDENFAKQKTVMHSTIRKIILLLALAVCWKLPQINLLTVVLAIMGLKAGVYFQPIVQKKMGRV
ncbi:MAG: hypothetical protein ACLTKI_07135 [Lachnospiraceae bacterium]